MNDVYQAYWREGNQDPIWIQSIPQGLLAMKQSISLSK